MASPAAENLRKAIIGYKGEHGGQQGHENIMGHLEKIHAEFERGRKGDEESPGKRSAASLASQREIPSERGHEGGDNNVISNEPHRHGGEFARTPERPGVIAPDYGHDDRIESGTAGVKSGGQVYSALPSGGYPGGDVSFRSVAASRARESENMREPSKTSGGNTKSVNKAPASPEGARVGEAPPPGKAGPDKNAGEYERVPGYVAKERLGRDEWERAADGVRKLLRAPKR